MYQLYFKYLTKKVKAPMTKMVNYTKIAKVTWVGKVAKKEAGQEAVALPEVPVHCFVILIEMAD